MRASVRWLWKPEREFQAMELLWKNKVDFIFEELGNTGFIGHFFSRNILNALPRRQSLVRFRQYVAEPDGDPFQLKYKDKPISLLQRTRRTASRIEGVLFTRRRSAGVCGSMLTPTQKAVVAL